MNIPTWDKFNFVHDYKELPSQYEKHKKKFLILYTGKYGNWKQINSIKHLPMLHFFTTLSWYEL